MRINLKYIKDIFKNKKFSNLINAVDYDYFDDLGEKLKEKYDNNVPFKHIVIDDFLEPKLCEYFLEKIPDRNHDLWKNTVNSDRINQPNKLGMFHIKNLYDYDTELALMFQIFNSFVIINFFKINRVQIFIS